MYGRAPIITIAAVRHTYLVCYDISNDLRLRRVHKALCGFGDRLQYSVFECRLSASDLARCKHALGRIIHTREDQVLFVDLGPADARADRAITAIGRSYSTLEAPCIIIDRDDSIGLTTGTKRAAAARARARRRLEEPGAEHDDGER